MLERAGETTDASRRADQKLHRGGRGESVDHRNRHRGHRQAFELGGTRSAMADLNLDTRTHTLHDRVRWKFNAVGNYHLNGAAPPKHAWI